MLILTRGRKTKVLLTSTSEVYGKSDKASFGEDDDLVLGPTSKGRWSYAASKPSTISAPEQAKWTNATTEFLSLAA